VQKKAVDLRHDIIDSVSTLRNIFVNLRNSGEEQKMKISQLVGELNMARAELVRSRDANLPGCAQPSRGGIGQSPVSATHYRHLVADQRKCIPRRSAQT